MENEFWLQRWERGDIGFHEHQPNPLLVSHMDQLKLLEGDRVFLPLCGKTLDIAWLLAQDYQVVGVELSELAIKALFTQLALEPEITTHKTLTRYSAQHIDIFAGDYFDLAAEYIGPVHAIYDRAALVAMPPTLRQRYARQLVQLTQSAPQLLITYEYNQSQMEGPPFSVPGYHIDELYGDHYHIHTLQRDEIERGLKAKVAATETVWLLQSKRFGHS